jgi:homoserine dehydrogenase
VKRLRIGLLGCGTVGGGFVALVDRERDRLRSRYSLDLTIDRILVRDAGKERRGIDPALLTTCATEVIDRDCDVIVEVVGGVHSAGTYVRRAIRQGRHVVTANKALLAATGSELFGAAAARGVTIGFEASVCGGVPVIGVLRRGLAGDSIESITGILNGTSNFILSRLHEGLGFAEALACAQELGFAEADPALDVSGQDAAQKLRILAGLAFDAPIRRTTVVGIDGITPGIIQNARSRGCVVRSVAEATRVAGGIELRVGPKFLAATEPLARIVDETNAIVIRGRAVGEIVLSGRGAGSMPTAAAVLADVLDISCLT